MILFTAYLSRLVKRYNISSHTIVVSFGLFTTFIAANQQARQQFETFLNHHPWQSLIYSFLIFASSTYKGSHTLEAQASNVAKAQQQAQEMTEDLSHNN